MKVSVLIYSLEIRSMWWHERMHLEISENNEKIQTPIYNKILLKFFGFATKNVYCHGICWKWRIIAIFKPKEKIGATTDWSWNYIVVHTAMFRPQIYPWSSGFAQRPKMRKYFHRCSKWTKNWRFRDIKTHAWNIWYGKHENWDSLCDGSVNLVKQNVQSKIRFMESRVHPV